MRLSRQRRATRAARTAGSPSVCGHLTDAAAGDEPQPRTRGCQECADDGENNWAHLRMCVACGHVGCCDSSPQRHATAHHHSTGHPVMRSIEPGESWRWCYVDLELMA